MLPIVIFDDGQGRLSPLCDLRPGFDIRTGACTNLERIERVLGRRAAGFIVPAAMEGVTRERHRLPVNSQLDLPSGAFLVNGRCVLPPAEAVQQQAFVEERSGDLICGTLDVAGVRDAVKNQGRVQPPAAAKRPGHVLLSRPWHVRTLRDAALDADLAHFCRDHPPYPHEATIFGEHEVCVHPTAKVYPGVVFDVESGPVVIGERATIRPACTIIGPAYIGEHSTILDRAIIKGHTAIGPWCKIAGEVGGTIFQGFSNKAHDGHLGDSWVGEWVNLGAGTTNSNLLNTYGEITCRALDEHGKPCSIERSGEQFLGAIIGDHVKLAINTRVMTGAVIGVGAMWAAGAALSGTVEPFSWVTDAGTRRYAVDKFIEVMNAAMGRRKIVPGAAYTERVKHLATRA